MTIFYNQLSLQDAMLITLSNKEVTRVENHDDFVVLFNNDDMVGVNIFNVSKTMALDNGLIYPTEEILNFIQTRTNLDLRAFCTPNFVVAEILECEDVEGTHLHKCKVDLGADLGKTQIVCGAINARAGLRTVCATVGTFMPSGAFIADGKLMSLESHGMLCSARELKIANDNKPGIIELDNSYTVGTPFKAVYANL
ncbi:YtpR family tRNA-binding protein [Ureaplasma ceti]|uniref:tRNA-binding domain-containing protein n=1 Tax=Ureaplasma ceti TaxID=3119530 RepID=A0ABP9U721_9BACT